MSDDLPFETPKITNADIYWATSLLNLPTKAFYGEDGIDPRQEVLKAMSPIDVTACPGSGKTTLLVAKLAILAKKWKYRTHGICVISHTNAARHQIENRLGHTTEGRRLLSYPHFIGTIHGFVNEFIALPWLLSKGYQIKMIDTDVCLEKRWNALKFKTRISLEKNSYTRSVLSVKSPDFGVGELHWGKGGKLRRETDTYCEISEVCHRSTTDGYFCYDEMFMWAVELMDKKPEVVHMIRNRFPLLFIDEAQDNSEDQSSILHRIFMDGGSEVIRQRFGDENQAIFDFLGDKEATTDKFPINSIKQDLPNSHRFGQKIADLADPLGIISFPCGLKGHGPKKILDSGAQEGRHTIFLFDDDSIGEVLNAYGDLLIDTFSEKELYEGSGKGMFVAVGQVHRDKGDNHKPRHVGHYWPDYDPELTIKEPKPQTFMQYVFAGQGKSETTGESYWAVEKIAEGILRLARMIEGGVFLSQRRHSHRYVLKLLEEYIDVSEDFENLITKVAVERSLPTKETWNGYWRGLVQNIAETIAGGSLSRSEAKDFLAWRDRPSDSLAASIAPSRRLRRDNTYHFSKNEKTVSIRVGSVHSVKGETHMSTLVLETFWQDNKSRHNLELLIPWLCKSNSGGQDVGVRQQYRLKLHYVAMTRPTHLLCLAMKQSTFKDSKGNIDHDKIKKLIECGWQIKQL